MSGLSLTDVRDMEKTLAENGGGTPWGEVMPAIPIVEGRKVYIDGDYIAYIVAADRVGEELTTMAQAKTHLTDFISQIMEACGAEDYEIHITQGDKGGRVDQARLKPYQANRANKEVPVLLSQVRRYIADELQSYVCTTAEADDSLAMRLHEARALGQEELAVLCSQDKDLGMCQGWHVSLMTGHLYYIDGLGELYVEEKTSTDKDGKKVVRKKVRGTGGLYFFFQLLTGDTADNISGLPQVVGHILNKIKPTKPITKAFEVLNDPESTDKQKESARKKLKDRKSGKCGDMTAYLMLKDCTTLHQAYLTVVAAYMAYHMEIGFCDYDGNDISLTEAFESECRLLYMRHNLNPDDFREYLDWVQQGLIDETRPEGAPRKGDEVKA